VNGGEDVEEESSSSDDVVAAANPLANTQSNNTESIVKIRLADDILLCALRAFQSICKRDFGCNELIIFLTYTHTHTHSHMLQHVLGTHRRRKKKLVIEETLYDWGEALNIYQGQDKSVSLSGCLLRICIYLMD
jgi:hypothetical protein